MSHCLDCGVCVCVSHSVQSCATLCDLMDRAPLSMEFSRQEYWSRLPFPVPGDLPVSGIEPSSPALQEELYKFLTNWATREAPTLTMFTVTFTAKILLWRNLHYPLNNILFNVVIYSTHFWRELTLSLCWDFLFFHLFQEDMYWIVEAFLLWLL